MLNESIVLSYGRLLAMLSRVAELYQNMVFRCMAGLFLVERVLIPGKALVVRAENVIKLREDMLSTVLVMLSWIQGLVAIQLLEMTARSPWLALFHKSHPLLVFAAQKPRFKIFFIMHLLSFRRRD